MNLEKDTYTQNKHIQAYISLSCHFDLELSEIKTCNAASGLQGGAVISMCSWIGSNCITQFSTKRKSIPVVCIEKCCVFFSVEVSKISSHFLCASLLNTSSKTSKPDWITTFAENCNKIAFWIKQNQMKDSPLTPGCTMFSVCTIKAAGTNETK